MRGWRSAWGPVIARQMPARCSRRAIVPRGRFGGWEAEAATAALVYGCNRGQAFRSCVVLDDSSGWRALQRADWAEVPSAVVRALDRGQDLTGSNTARDAAQRGTVFRREGSTPRRRCREKANRRLAIWTPYPCCRDAATRGVGCASAM